MEMRFLNNLPKEVALGMVVDGLQKLTEDYALNIQHGLFLQLFGRELNLPEFLVMMVMEKDMALRHGIR